MGHEKGGEIWAPDFLLTFKKADHVDRQPTGSFEVGFYGFHVREHLSFVVRCPSPIQIVGPHDWLKWR